MRIYYHYFPFDLLNTLIIGDHDLVDHSHTTGTGAGRGENGLARESPIAAGGVADCIVVQHRAWRHLSRRVQCQ